MPYSPTLAARIRQILTSQRGVVEKKLFGGVGFLLYGNMCVCVWKDSLIARLGAEQAAAALEQLYVGEFDVTGRPMKGWVMIEPDGIETDSQLRGWIGQAIGFVITLPPK